MVPHGCRRWRRPETACREGCHGRREIAVKVPRVTFLSDGGDAGSGTMVAYRFAGCWRRIPDGVEECREWAAWKPGGFDGGPELFSFCTSLRRHEDGLSFGGLDKRDLPIPGSALRSYLFPANGSSRDGYLPAKITAPASYDGMNPDRTARRLRYLYAICLSCYAICLSCAKRSRNCAFCWSVRSI